MLLCLHNLNSDQWRVTWDWKYIFCDCLLLGPCPCINHKKSHEKTSSCDRYWKKCDCLHVRNPESRVLARKVLPSSRPDLLQDTNYSHLFVMFKFYKYLYFLVKHNFSTLKKPRTLQQIKLLLGFTPRSCVFAVWCSNNCQNTELPLNNNNNNNNKLTLTWCY